MAVLTIKKIRLIAVRTQKDELMHELLVLGLIEVSPPDKQLEEHCTSGRREIGSLTRLRTDHEQLLSGIELLDKYAPVKSRLFTSRAKITQREFLDFTSLENCLALAKELEQKDKRIKCAAAEESRQRSLIESFTPWEDLDVPLDELGTEHTAVFKGVLPVRADVSELEAQVYACTGDVQIFYVSSDKYQHYLLTVCMRDELKQVADVMRGLGLTAPDFRGATGTARDNIMAAQIRLKALADEKRALAAEIAGSSNMRGEMRLSADRIKMLISLAESEERMLFTEKAFILDGWVSADKTPDLEALLGNYDCAWELSDTAIPVKFGMGGKTFKPLSISPAYVDIIQEGK